MSNKYYSDIPSREKLIQEINKEGDRARGKVGSAYRKFYNAIRNNPDDYEEISDCLFTILGKTRQLIEARAQAVRKRKELDRAVYGGIHENNDNKEVALFESDFQDALAVRKNHLLTFEPNSTEDLALRSHFIWLDKLGLQMAPNIMVTYYHQSREEIETRIAEQEAWLKEDRMKKEEKERRYDPDYYFDEPDER